MQIAPLSHLQKMTYALGNLPVIVPALVLGQWLVYFYVGSENDGRPAYASITIVSMLGFLGAVANGLCNPLIGYFSDRHTTRFGRRLPWMAISGPILAILFIATWFPPHSTQSLGNTVWAIAIVIPFWVLHVAYSAPYLSLLPEIATVQRDRVFLSMLQGIVEVVGNIIGLAIVPLVISSFASGLHTRLFSFDDGFQVNALIVGTLVFATSLLPLINIRERAASTLTAIDLGFRQAIVETFRNPAFLPYVVSLSFYRLCLMMLMIASPFLVTRVIGGDEAHLAPLMGSIIVVGALLFPLTLKATNVFGMRRVFLVALFGFAVVIPFLMFVGEIPLLGKHPFIGDLLYPMFSSIISPAHTPRVEYLHAGALFVLFAAPVSVFLVLPRAIMAEVIDEDERRTGYRREAMYNGVEGLLTTAGWGAAFLVNGALLKIWDIQSGETLGVLLTFPLAGLLMLIAGLIFRRYPLGAPEKVDR